MSEDSKEIQKVFSTLSNHISGHNNRIANINKILASKEVQPVERISGPASLSTYLALEDKGANSKLLRDLTEHILESDVFCKVVVKQISDLNRSHLIKLAMDKETRRAERWDMWKLWGQKSVRWALGAALTVTLYSATVWASEKYDFIKFPVKDSIEKFADKAPQ